MGDDTIIWFFLILITSILVSVPAAFIMDASLHKKTPAAMPYKWGYYTGWTGILSGSGLAILQFIEASKAYGGHSDTFVMWGIVYLIAAVAHFFIIERNKWAWIIGIVLQFNPILWIVNGVYLRNRWTELNSLPAGTFTSQFNRTSIGNRILIAGSAFWAFVVLAFVFTFEPYGNRIEWWHVIKIIIFPPVVAAIGYFLYSKVVRLEHDKSL